MEIIGTIIGFIIIVGYVVLCILFLIWLIVYPSQVFGNKKHKDDDDKIVINFKIEDVEPKEPKRSKSYIDYDD